MQRYTVRSRGVPIGTTDLGFARVDGLTRCGWFHPNEEGERVMATVNAVLPLMHASVRREVREGSAVVVLSVEVEGPELPPELLAAMQAVETLELTLHRADGALIPTENVGLQDVEQLRSIYVDDEDTGADAAAWYEGLDDETREAIERDVAAILDDAGFARREPWMPEPEAPPEALGPDPLERYQVIVRLESEWDVP